MVVSAFTAKWKYGHLKHMAQLILCRMLTIKSDDVYGRSKAYESIIKQTEIVGPKVPESFNVLVKIARPWCLKVDLIASDQLVDARSRMQLTFTKKLRMSLKSKLQYRQFLIWM